MDADVYGPSLPTMVAPGAERTMAMDPATRTLKPVEHLGVRLASLGFTSQGAAIMRGPMASGLVQQLLLGTDWGAQLPLSNSLGAVLLTMTGQQLRVSSCCVRTIVHH